MKLSRILFIVGSLISSAIAFLISPIVAIADAIGRGFTTLFMPDHRTQAKLDGFTQSLKSISNRWRAALAFINRALKHEKFVGNQFSDARSPSFLV
ncbi:hypothetical protein [Maritalea sp.]|uniref:hypothetical protein n=1 Tax=Maritalea sp. TaxID=2003361 RepID=UPI003EF93646